ncbi:MAG: Nif3-like dinuclear metal center hexameric protein [Armatimonadota bacterium]
MRIADIGTYLAGLLSPAQLEENQRYTSMLEEGLRFGDDGAEVTGVLLCWMSTAAAIRAGIDQGCNVIICHEDPYFQSYANPPELSAGWLANRERLRLLIEGGITVYRCHSPLDVLYTIDAALDALELDIRSLYSEWIARVAIVPEMTVGELVERARRGFGVEGVRLVGDPDRRVTAVGISAGGMGLSGNCSFNEWLRRRGAEVLVTGEMDDYSAYWVVESGIAMIAVGHAASEEPGLRRFYARLQRDFPAIPSFFHSMVQPIDIAELNR